MTRAKKKLPSVAGRTFTPIKKKKPQKEAFHPDSYRSRKQKGLASKKKQKSVYQKFVDNDADWLTFSLVTNIKASSALKSFLLTPYLLAWFAASNNHCEY